MTYNEAISLIRNPHELNAKDAGIEGFQNIQVGDNAFGYRIYIVDKKGNRYSPTRPTFSWSDKPIENNVYYWHNKRIAQAYMVYLANALPQYTYGIYSVDTVKGDRLQVEGIYAPHASHFGQYASELHVRDDAPISILTPEMLHAAQASPDAQLFS